MEIMNIQIISYKTYYYNKEFMIINKNLKFNQFLMISIMVKFYQKPKKSQQTQKFQSNYNKFKIRKFKYTQKLAKFANQKYPKTKVSEIIAVILFFVKNATEQEF